jgi:hypothetical protein
MSNNDNNFLSLPDAETILNLNAGFQPMSTRAWSRDIKKLYNNKCVLSNKTSSETTLVRHHLFSKKDNPLLQFNLLNGIPIPTENHKASNVWAKNNCNSLY